MYRCTVETKNSGRCREVAVSGGFDCSVEHNTFSILLRSRYLGRHATLLSTGGEKRCVTTQIKAAKETTLALAREKRGTGIIYGDAC